MKVEYIDLNEMKVALEHEGFANDIQLFNNKLTYTAPDGTNVVIEERFEEYEQIFLISEGDSINEIIINANANTLSYNGGEVLITYPSINELNFNTELQVANDDLHLVGNVYPNIYSETAIKNMAASVLYTLMFSALGGLGTTLSLAYTIISGFTMINSFSKVVYVHRLVYSNDLGTYLYYEDYFYASSNYTNLVASNYYEKYF